MEVQGGVVVAESFEAGCMQLGWGWCGVWQLRGWGILEGHLGLGLGAAAGSDRSEAGRVWRTFMWVV